MEEREPVEPDEADTGGDEGGDEEDEDEERREAVTGADDTGLVGQQEYINKAEDRPA